MQLVPRVTIADANLSSSTVTESETLWSGATTYGAAARVYRVIDSVHQAFVSQQASNTNHIPEDDDGTWWLADGPTNRWAPFDGSVGSLASRATSAQWVLAIAATERVDTLYLAGLSALSVRVRMTDAIAGAVYDETVNLSDPSGVTDWYVYFTLPVTYLSELLISELPYGAGPTLTIDLDYAGGTVTCGVIHPGYARELGGTRWGAQLGIRDYSVKQDDEFGNAVVVERAFRKRGSFSLIVENRLMDALIATLAAYRATLALYVGDTGYASTAILGFYKDFAVEMALPPDRSLCSLELESLV